jgi:hypothetical protein
MDVEFKLFGALTIRQFGQLVASFIVATILYFLEWPGLLKYSLIFISIIVGLFLALVRINGQPSSVFLGNYIIALFSPQQRVWKKTAITPEILKTQSTEIPKLVQTQVINENTILRSGGNNKIMGASMAPLSSLANNVNSQNQSSQEDAFENQRLKQIEQHFDSAISNLNNSNVVKRTNVTPPSSAPKQTYNLSNSNIPNISQFNSNNQKLGVSVNMTSPNSSVVMTGGSAATVVNHLNNTQVNRSINIQDNGGSTRSLELKNDLTSNFINNANNIEPKIQESATIEKSGIIKGVIVDSANNIITFGEVIVSDMSNKTIEKINISEDGKVITNTLTAGEYYLDISVTGYQFNRYKILVSGSESPIYKFKSR